MYCMALDCHKLAKNEYGFYARAFCFILFPFTHNLVFVVAVLYHGAILCAALYLLVY